IRIPDNQLYIVIYLASLVAGCGLLEVIKALIIDNYLTGIRISYSPPATTCQNRFMTVDH
ncbi:MAG: hypothetical protein ACR2J4_05055, partial [Deinococcus sp.]